MSGGPPPPPPPYPTRFDGGGPSPRANPAMALLVAVGATAAALIVMLASKDALAERTGDDKHFLVQVALFGVGGLGWALIQPGADRALRAGLGAAAGAGIGTVGTLLLGSTDLHGEALSDAVLSGGSLGRAALWALVGAAGWAVTIVAGTVRDRMPQAATGAALGGGASGATMGLLAGTYQFGDSVIPTDVWLTFPFTDAGEAMRSIPVLLFSTIVPLVLATTAVRAVRLRPAVAAGVTVCLLLPAVGGLAGYSTDLDQARRDGLDMDADVRVPQPGPRCHTTRTVPADVCAHDRTGHAQFSDRTHHAQPADPAEPADRRHRTEPDDPAADAISPFAATGTHAAGTRGSERGGDGFSRVHHERDTGVQRGPGAGDDRPVVRKAIPAHTCAGSAGRRSHLHRRPERRRDPLRLPVEGYQPQPYVRHLTALLADAIRYRRRDEPSDVDRVQRSGR